MQNTLASYRIVGLTMLLLTFSNLGALAGLLSSRDEVITQQTTRLAINAMNRAYYNQTDGRWSARAAWWLTGNALQAVLDYTHKTGSDEFLPQVLNTIERQRGPLPWWPQGGGLFRADSTDDTGWWALAMVRMYDVTGDARYLEVAALDEEYMFSFWQDGWCGGGVIQEVRPGRNPYKNAISNTLYIKVAASLAGRVKGEPRFLERARMSLAWFLTSGMINDQGLVNDGITNDCANNGQPTWTYNQGVILGALVELSRATGNGTYLAPARRIADAVLASRDLVGLDGILREPCEAREDCDGNGAAFKGIFARNLAELDATLVGSPYGAFLDRNARSASEVGVGRDGEHNYQLGWSGKFDEARTSISSQSAAVSLLVAALRLRVD